MPNVALVPAAPTLSLPEYTVGKAASECIYPGVDQCFAITGIRGSNMICTHVSPGSTAQNIADIFRYLDELGGTWVLDWYVIGTCNEFFSRASAPWKSRADMRASFTARFGDTGANHWLLDNAGLRPRDVHGYIGYGVDIRAVFDPTTRTASFSYKQAFANHITTWTALNAGAFNRF